MNKDLLMPDEETRKRLITNLRQTRLELQELGLELEEIISLIEKDIRQQKLKRLEKSRQNLAKGY